MDVIIVVLMQGGHLRPLVIHAGQTEGGEVLGRRPGRNIGQSARGNKELDGGRLETENRAPLRSAQCKSRVHYA